MDLAAVSINGQYLPTLLADAAAALVNARDAAEVLEARDLATLAYDVAKRTARLAKAKQAHDDLIVAAHRAQAHALQIEARAKLRLADEYDAAQERGEVASTGQHARAVPDGNSSPRVTTADLGATWSPHPTSDGTLIEPNCNGSLRGITLRDGRRLLLFANPSSQERRSHQSIRVSDDDGRTWPEARRILLDEGLGRGYPSLSPIDPDRVGIVYEGSRADVVFQSIPTADLIASP